MATTHCDLTPGAPQAKIFFTDSQRGQHPAKIEGAKGEQVTHE